MACKLIHVLTLALAIHVIGATRLMCPSHPNCVCGGTFAVELNCNIDGNVVKINLLPNTYINIKCENVTTLDYSKLPKCANEMNNFKSVSFKDCPLPTSSFKDVLEQLGVSKTMSLIFQNAKNLSGYFDRKHFSGLRDLTKLLLSVSGITHLPDNLFTDVNNLTWLNIRCNSINISEQLFKPLERLETLEISHNQMTNVSSNIFSHLAFLRKLSLWQSNVTWFSKDFFSGVNVLEELDLSSNGLNELPTLIFKPLSKLKKLTLFSNKFSSLPQNLFSTNNNLETVIILNNDVKMKELPRSLFGNLQNLKQIYIQRCGIEIVPYDVFGNSSQITNISLAYNDIGALRESTFNDQINLLELDLSHNNLKNLEPKLFSSLVRLEKLDLAYNSIEEISGSTFSSLLSLIYLSMEHNKLKTITSYLFSNNRQRMTISFAYNELDFETKELRNNSWTVNKVSPFLHTYSLKLLNLSHNKFEVTYDDWWINGHENLDISFNSIQSLWNHAPYSYKTVVKKPMKQLWIGHNPLHCYCKNFKFLDFLKEHFKAQVKDESSMHCSIWKKEACNMRFTIFVCFISVSASLSTILMLFYLKYRKQLHSMIKNKLFNISHSSNNKEKERSVIIKYSEKDEEFVFKEILPGLRVHKNLRVHTKPIASDCNKENFIKQLKNSSKEGETTLVIFSPNYLMSAYSHVNIKKIRGEMLKAKKTVYVFTDMGTENSIYAFLKEQRDRRTTILWNNPNFWNILLPVLSKEKYKMTFRGKDGVKQREPIDAPQATATKNSASVSDRPADPLDTFLHYQV
ncbi:protein toll-like [Colias croceus]|uniref:protein toll-like n=1 Tax=Colias crocea TaxID=72248 RepID=UPI001E27C418|nr:protein toll-like [Colias croceus]XP_045496839.1 protein toll-like [Colias croceus]